MKTKLRWKRLMLAIMVLTQQCNVSKSSKYKAQKLVPLEPTTTQNLVGSNYVFVASEAV